MCQNNIRRYSPMNDQYLILPLKLMISFAAICRLKKKKKRKRKRKKKKNPCYWKRRKSTKQSRPEKSRTKIRRGLTAIFSFPFSAIAFVALSVS